MSAVMLVGGLCVMALAGHMHIMQKTGMYDSTPPCEVVGVALVVGGVVLLVWWPKHRPGHRQRTRDPDDHPRNEKQ